MRRNPIGRQSKRQRKVFKKILAAIEPQQASVQLYRGNERHLLRQVTRRK